MLEVVDLSVIVNLQLQVALSRLHLSDDTKQDFSVAALMCSSAGKVSWFESVFSCVASYLMMEMLNKERMLAGSCLICTNSVISKQCMGALLLVLMV